jgi:hypothetical protein
MGVRGEEDLHAEFAKIDTDKNQMLSLDEF